MLRLAPSRPPLWRTPSSLQLGVDGEVRLEDVTPWQERLLHALGDGIPDAMLAPLARSLGAAPADAEAFVAQIAPALVPVAPPRLAVQVQLPIDIAFAEADALARGWSAAGVDPVRTVRWAPEDPDPTLPLIVVADRLLDPRQAAALMAADITHLPIEVAGDRAEVGPLVVPGATACLSCRHARRTEADEQWPLLAAQLLGRERIRTDTAILLEAALLAARLLRGAPGTDPRASLSVTISSADARRTWHVHRPHVRCLCLSPLDRSPGGSASAPGAEAARPFPRSAPTTATGIARPA